MRGLGVSSSLAETFFSRLQEQSVLAGMAICRLNRTRLPDRHPPCLLLSLCRLCHRAPHQPLCCQHSLPLRCTPRIWRTSGLCCTQPSPCHACSSPWRCSQRGCRMGHVLCKQVRLVDAVSAWLLITIKKDLFGRVRVLLDSKMYASCA